MNQEELLGILEGALDNNAIILSGGLFESDDITALLTNFLTIDELEIISAALTEVDDEIHITGTVSLFNLEDISVTIVMGIQNDTPTFLLPLTLPQGWKFPDSFPALESVAFNDLEISDGQLILASATSTDAATGAAISVGLNFLGTITASGQLAVLTPLLETDSQFFLSGLFSSLEPTIATLSTAVFPDIACASIGLTDTQIRFEISPPSIDEIELEDDEEAPEYPDDFVLCDIFIEGTVTIGDGIQMRLCSEVPQQSDELLLRASFDGIQLPSIGDLAPLVGAADLVDTLPEELQDFGEDIALKEASFSFSTESSEILRSEVTLTLTQSFSLFPGLDVLSADALDFAWFVDNPTGSPDIGYAIEASIRIADSFDMIVQLEESDTLYLYTGLAEDNSVNLDSVLEYFLSGLDGFFPSTFPSLTVIRFSIEAKPRQDAYSLYAFLDSSWEIIPGLADLVELEIAADYDGASTPQMSGKIAGVFIVSEVEIYVETEKLSESPDAGWEFSGSTDPGQEIEIGDLIADIGNLFGDTTLPAVLTGLIIDNLAVSFNTATSDFSFTCEALFPVGDQEVDITVTIDCQNASDGTYTHTFAGHIEIGGLQFDLIFSEDPDSDSFIAAFRQEGGTSVPVKDLVAAVSSDVAASIPDDLSLTLIDALFAYTRIDSASSKFLFGLDLSAALNLSELPLVGQEFPADQTVGVEDLQLLVASTDFGPADCATLNALIPTDLSPLPDRTLTTGFNLSATLQFGDTSEQLDMALADDGNAGDTSSDANSTDSSALAPTASDNTLWYKLQKSFGPVHFERVGVQYKDNALWFLLDAALAETGLTLSLNGLSIGSPLSEFAPQFALTGIGIDYQNNPVEIGGSFLRITTEDGDEYQGTAVLKTEGYSLAALGSYTEVDGTPSMFIYAVLEEPLGGPPFFFVTGLTAGFGYNRSLTTPSITDVETFPLVQAAIDGSGNPDDLTGAINNLSPYVAPAPGADFLALGVKFTSFKIIDSFALFLFVADDHPEIQVLGLAKLIAPTPETGQSTTPLAEVQMALKGNIDPSEGLLGIKAQLTSDSYILSKDCHLTGGFAFYSWFSGSHAGDFVQTLGGYHPQFNVPSHYPSVPRLKFNWKLDSHTTINGDAYCALTAHALMAGGNLKATWQSGNLKAWFNAGADFLVAWKPYHYDAQMHVNVGVSYKAKVKLGFATIHKTFKAHIGADVHLWGPEFSGKAHVHWSIISFTISFGHSSTAKATAIEWDTFRASFLPDALCSIAAQGGLQKSIRDGGKEIWIINPKQLTLATDSLIPTNAASVDLGSANTDFGIGSMEVSAANLTSTHTIVITRGSTDVTDEFAFTPIFKDVPTGLWGQSLTPELNGDLLIENVLTGFTIKPLADETTGETDEIACADLADNDIALYDGGYTWEETAPFPIQDLGEAATNLVLYSVPGDSITDERDSLLDALGMGDAEISLSQWTEDDFVTTPQIVGDA